MPGVTVSITSPSMQGTRTDVTGGDGIYRFSAIPPGDYTVKYELAGFETIIRTGLRVGLGFTATVNIELKVASLTESRHRKRAIAGRRRRDHEDLDQLRRPAAGFPAERPRLLVDSGGRAGHPDAAHRRRRQRRRHADRLFDLRHEVRSASADGRGDREHGGHQRRRLLLRLRRGGGSLRDDRRKHAGDAVGGCDDAVHREVRRQRVPRPDLCGLREREHPVAEHRSGAAGSRGEGRRRPPGDRSQPHAQLSRPERRCGWLHQAGQAVVVQLAAGSGRHEPVAELSGQAVRDAPPERHGQGDILAEPEQQARRVRAVGPEAAAEPARHLPRRPDRGHPQQRGLDLEPVLLGPHLQSGLGRRRQRQDVLRDSRRPIPLPVAEHAKLTSACLSGPHHQHRQRRQPGRLVP